MKNPKRKGSAGEREAAAFLREHGFTAAKRCYQFHGGGPDCPDVDGVPGWHLEVKRVERLNLRDATAQASGDCGGKPWCILHRWNHGPWLATIRAEDWLALVRDTMPPQHTLAPAPAPCGVDTAPEPEQTNEQVREQTMKASDMYPSRWLKAADVARPVLAVIKNVTFEEVVEGEQKPVLHFAGTIKPMVLNKTNTASLTEICGSDDTDDWTNRSVVLYSAKVQFQSKIVDAIRIRASRQAPAPAATATATAQAKPAAAPEPASDETDDVPY